MMHNTVQPSLQFLAPKFNNWVFQAIKRLLPFWIAQRCNVQQIQVVGLAELASFYQQFQQGKIRLLIAYRHPTCDDPIGLMHLISNLLPQGAQQQNIQLRLPVHLHFLYDRGIPLWAGKGSGWLFSRLGATPIYRGKLDLVGLRSARHIAVNGQFPLAIAPEGAINGQSDRLNSLEPGIARLGFWAVEDLQKASRSEQVIILPINVQYRYVRPAWKNLEKLFEQLEKDSGLPPLNLPHPEVSQHSPEWFCHRLDRLSHHLLEQMESFYTRFHQQKFVGTGTISDRLQELLQAALGVAERQFGLPESGSLIERRHRIEQAAWARIYRSDLADLKTLSPLEKGLADRVAAEANLNLWHMQWAESFLNVTEQYVLEKPSFDRIAEMALLLWDFVSKIKQGRSAKRPQLGLRQVRFRVGNSISVSERWNDYRRNKSGSIATLLQDLQAAFEHSTATASAESIKPVSASRS